MSITQTLTNVFKQDCLDGAQNLGTSGDTIKIALYTSSATLNATTTAYTTSNEVSGTGYTAGGTTLSSQSVTLDTTNGVAFFDAADPSFTSATITARGALIYNTTTDGGSNTTDAVAVLNFGADKTATSGTFTIQFPAFTTSASILRLA